MSGFGTDTADGGAGTDTLVVNYGEAVGNISMARPGTDQLGGYLGAVVGAGWRIDYTGIEKFEVATGSGNDFVAVRGSGNLVSLGGGNDAFEGEGGVDSADGGAGTDSASVNLAGAVGPILWNLAANSYSGPGSYSNFESFLSLETGNGNDVIVTLAADLADRVALGSGDDSVTVVNGFDFVNGWMGSDLLIVDYSAATASVLAPTPGIISAAASMDFTALSATAAPAGSSSGTSTGSMSAPDRAMTTSRSESPVRSATTSSASAPATTSPISAAASTRATAAAVWTGSPPTSRWRGAPSPSISRWAPGRSPPAPASSISNIWAGPPRGS